MDSRIIPVNTMLKNNPVEFLKKQKTFFIVIVLDKELIYLKDIEFFERYKE